ncbi:MAG: protein kinase [Isosphaeraceae bacterium]|nr:protein kinase [Isosphaeraceae bacterium]
MPTRFAAPPTRLAEEPDPSTTRTSDDSIDDESETKITPAPSAGPAGPPIRLGRAGSTDETRVSPATGAIPGDDDGFEVDLTAGRPAAGDSLEAWIAQPKSRRPPLPPAPEVVSPAPPAAGSRPLRTPPRRRPAAAGGGNGDRTDRPAAPGGGGGGKPKPIDFPKLGTKIRGFRLDAHLGRGAFARVYRAAEIGLGDRPVALKISRAEGDEPRVLARFQHTNIVPIYSVVDDEATGLRLMCMPYFGGANLAEILDAAQEAHRSNEFGRSLVEALDRVGNPIQLDREDASARPSGPFVPLGGSRPGTRSDPIEAAARHSGLAGQMSPPGPRLRIDGSQQVVGPISSVEAVTPARAIRARTGVRSFLGRLPFWSAVPEIDGPPPDAELEVGGTAGEATQPNRVFLRGTTFVRASVWIVRKLADGLEHAHSRHFLHRDLKPSNILIAADGTPMLLDFNLAAHSADWAEEGEKAKMGGTLPYMAPEHLDAFRAGSGTKPEMVDERSDLYALGLILFEMIAGRHPFDDIDQKKPRETLLKEMIAERTAAPPSLRAMNPKVPWSLDAIVRKAMAPRPEDRYQSAAQFGSELQRFLDDEPLRHTKEPSLRESAVKWSRRHPRLTSGSGVGIFAACVVISLSVTASTLANHLRSAAARLELGVVETSAQDCRFLLNAVPDADLETHQIEGIKKSRELRERLGIGRGRDWTKASWMRLLSPDEQVEVRGTMAELIQLEARARVALARSRDATSQRLALKWAVKWLDEVETFEPEPAHSLFVERAKYHAALGDAGAATRDRNRAERVSLETPRDLYLTAIDELGRGREDSAERLLNRAISRDRRNYWCWFVLGLCHIEQGRFNDAANDFAVCSIILPKFAWSAFNRGYALARAGRLIEAREAYAGAIELRPQFAEALARRGLVSLELGDASAAETDLQRAIELGRGDPIVRAALAEALAKQGRRTEALATIDQVIHAHPEDARWYVTRGMMVLRSDRDSALADFAKAVELDPALAIARLAVARALEKHDDPGAIAAADRALELDAGMIDALESRMLAKARLGRLDARADLERLLATPTANRIYNAACAMAILSERRGDSKAAEEARALLQRALEAGFPKERADSDPELASIRPKD